jgi:hypothetical protein
MIMPLATMVRAHGSVLARRCRAQGLEIRIRPGGVVGAVAGNTDHAERVETGEGEQDEAQEAPRHQHPLSTRGFVEATLPPEESDLMDGQPHESEVHPAQRRLDRLALDGAGTVQEVDHGRREGQRDGDRRTEPAVEPEHSRRRRNDRQVYRQEPQRHRNQPSAHYQDLLVGDEEACEQGDGYPRHGEHDGRSQQTLTPRPQPVAVALAGLQGGIPRRGVGESADDEENRHDLKDPGKGMGPRCLGQQVTDDDPFVGDGEHRDQPVAENDDADGHRTQEVHVAVPLRRRLSRDLAGAVHELHVRAPISPEAS